MRNEQCLLNVKPTRGTLLWQQWNTRLRHIVFTTEILYSILLLAKWTYTHIMHVSKLLKLPFSAWIFHCVEHSLAAFFLSLSWFFILFYFGSVQSHYIAVFLLFRCRLRNCYFAVQFTHVYWNWCIRYDWFVMCIWFVCFSIYCFCLFFLVQKWKLRNATTKSAHTAHSNRKWNVK